MPTRTRKLRQQLKELRATCIEQESDVILRKIAYEIECAVRLAIEDTVRWPSLSEMAKAGAHLLKQELARGHGREIQDPRPPGETEQSR